MNCLNCGSKNVFAQAITETKRRGFFGALLIIVLLFIPIIGWIALISLLRGRKSKTDFWVICQSCGYRWKIDKPAQPQMSVSNEPRFETLVPNTQNALEDILKQNVEVSENEYDWTITKTGLKYALKSRIQIDGAPKDAHVELVFTNDKYDSFSVTSLQIDGDSISF